MCADDQLSNADVGSIVGRLVDKSLLVTDGSGRYRLLQTLAQYGRERLVARDDNEAVRDRHAEYYRVLAERSWVDWRQPGGRPQTWWIGHLTDELDNLRAALTWSIGRPDAETARLLAGSLAFYWWSSGRTAEGHGWLGQALACAGDVVGAGARTRRCAWAACPRHQGRPGRHRARTDLRGARRRRRDG